MAIGTPVERYAVSALFNASSQTISPASNCTAGTKLVMVSTSLQGILSVSDSKNGAWTLDKTFNGGQSGYILDVCSIQAGSALLTSDTITITYNSSANFFYQTWIQEVSGLISGAALDKTATNSGFSGTPDCGTTATLTQADEIAFGLLANANGHAFTPGAGWTFVTTGELFSSNNALIYKIVAATTALTPNGTASTEHWDGLTVTYKASASASAPVNTALPAVTGTGSVGSTLTTDDGTWTGSPSPTFTRVWQRAGVTIGGATGTTYVLVDGDDATNITCATTGTNASGSATATSNAVAVTEPKPTNSVAGVASGTVHVGDTVSATPGTWTHQGGTIATYQYQWQDCATSGGTYADITGATNANYTILVGELTKFLACNAKATNSGGQSTSATATNVLGPVTAAVVSTSKKLVQTAQIVAAIYPS